MKIFGTLLLGTLAQVEEEQNYEWRMGYGEPGNREKKGFAYKLYKVYNFIYIFKILFELFVSQHSIKAIHHIKSANIFLKFWSLLKIRD